jgi:hypothetical protein
VVFPHHLDFIPNLHVLLGIAKKVADHPYVASVG